eukprot:1814413-Rhodomonas_salina.1
MALEFKLTSLGRTGFAQHHQAPRDGVQKPLLESTTRTVRPLRASVRDEACSCKPQPLYGALHVPSFEFNGYF